MAAPAAPEHLSLRIATGLLGVLIASLTAGLNEYVVKNALMDIKGALFIGYDEGTWLTALYSAASVSAMAFAPWCSYTFSIRRITLFAIASFGLLGALCPFVTDQDSFFALRTLQGLMAGCLPPMLMTVALRFLPAHIKLYGLGAYALTATFAPNIALPLAALWTEYAHWEWAFWQVIPLCGLSYLAVSYGLPQDPLHLERFKQFDWIGFSLGLPGLWMLCLGLLQGDKYNWFASPLISSLLIGGLGLMMAFFINESTHPLPFFRLDILKRRNFTHGLISLIGILVMMGVIIELPNKYLAIVHDYRPLQSAPIMLLVALPQLLGLGLVAALCNRRAVDCRWVLAAGILCCAVSCWGFSQLTQEWTRENFYLLMALQSIGQPMAIIPLLMLATGAVVPAEGVFASSWFNTTRGLSAVLGSSLVSYLLTERGRFHSDVLVGQLGNNPQELALRLTEWQQQLPDLDEQAALELLAQQIHQQVLILSLSDIFLSMTLVAAALLLLTLVIPTRIYPPRAASAAP